MKISTFICIVAIAGLSTAACDSRTGVEARSSTGEGNGASESNAMRPVETVNHPTETGKACGVYLGKPSVDQVTQELQADQGAQWDRNPDAQTIPRDQFIEGSLVWWTGGGLQDKPLKDWLALVPAAGPERFGIYTCDMADRYPEIKLQPLTGVDAVAARNLAAGLNYCWGLKSSRIRPATEHEIEYASLIRETLCPQIARTTW